MMFVFHSATFSCSYFSAELRAASMVWCTCQWLSPIAWDGMEAYALNDVLELVCGERRLSCYQRIFFPTLESTLTAMANVRRRKKCGVDEGIGQVCDASSSYGQRPGVFTSDVFASKAAAAETRPRTEQRRLREPPFLLPRTSPQQKNGTAGDWAGSMVTWRH